MPNATTTPRYTVVYEGSPAGAKILSGEAAPGKAVAVMFGDLVADNLDRRLAAIADDAELMRLVDLSHAAYPGPWYDGDEYIVGSETADGGDIICDMPSEGDDSRRNWPANRTYIIASANHVRERIRRRQDELQARLLAPPDLSSAVEG